MTSLNLDFCAKLAISCACTPAHSTAKSCTNESESIYGTEKPLVGQLMSSVIRKRSFLVTVNSSRLDGTSKNVEHTVTPILRRSSEMFSELYISLRPYLADLASSFDRDSVHRQHCTTTSADAPLCGRCVSHFFQNRIDGRSR